MRRQEPASSVVVPERLCRYVASDWPGEEDPLWVWTLARLDFVRVHGNETPIGGMIAVLGEHRRLVLLGLAGDGAA